MEWFGIVTMWRLSILVFVIITTLGISLGMQAQAFPLLLKNDIGATYQDLGNIGMAKFLPYIVIPIFIGILLDRVNNVYLLLLGILLCVIPLFMISITNSVTEMFIWQLMMGASHSFLWPSSESILSGDIKRRKKYIARFIMCFVAGMMVGPLLGAFILEVSDDNLRLLFQVAGGILATSITLTYWMRHARPKKKHPRISFKSFAKIFHFPMEVVLVMLSSALFGLIIAIHPAFLSDRGVDPSLILVLFFVYGASRMLSMLVVPRLHDHTAITLTACAVMIAVAMAIFVFETSYAYYVVAMALLGTGVSVIYPMCLEVILSRTHRHTHNIMIGSYATVTGTGRVLGPVLGGYVASAFGPVGLYWAFFIIGVVVALASISLHRKRNTNRLDQEWNALSDSDA